MSCDANKYMSTLVSVAAYVCILASWWLTHIIDSASMTFAVVIFNTIASIRVYTLTDLLLPHAINLALSLLLHH